MKAAPDAHDPLLIGMYGNAVATRARDKVEEVAQGLALMELAASHVSHPRLELARAQAEQRLGRTSAARSRLESILSANPNMEAAQRLLATLGK